MDAKPRLLLFRSRQRLHSSPEFEFVYKSGTRSGDALFGIAAKRNALGYPRLGLSVGTKAVGNSVRRNRLRRVLREQFRLSQLHLPGVDIVITARPGARAAPPAAIVESVTRLLKQIRARYP